MTKAPIGLFAATIACAISPACHAQTRDWPPAGGWDVVEGDTYCGIHQTFEGKGETELSLLLTAEGTAILGLTNLAWSSEDGEKYDLKYLVNGKVYGGGASTGYGAKYDVRKGFSSSFPKEFIDDFAAGKSLIIFKGSVIVDNLSLEGTGAAIATARRCLAAVRREIAAAEAEKQRFSAIADDPFAKGNNGVTATPPNPRGNPADWFTESEYPPAALRAAVQGDVTVALSIDDRGRVVGCRITKSSSSAELDDATCKLAERAGRFDPARDDRGDAAPGEWSGTARWRLPEQ